MRGHLKKLILKLLEKESLSGSEIINKINTIFNWTPSCGSIYPMLNSIEKEGLSTSTLKDGKKIYSLTIQGKKAIKEMNKERKELINAMEKSYKLLESVYGFDTNLERDMLEDIKKGDMPFQEIFEESMELKKELIRIKKQKKLSKNASKIKSIINKATADLKNI